jgi:pyridoxine 4-dehydrogenase
VCIGHELWRTRKVFLPCSAIQEANEGKLEVDMATAAKHADTFKLGGKLEIHRFGYGAMRITGEGIWGWPNDREEAKRVVRRAVELGIDFIDTADSYGPAVSEILIGEALAPYGNGTIIATKGGLTRQGPNRWLPVGRPEYLIQQVEMSLRHLKKETLDLWQLHRIDPKVPVEESLGAVKKLQEQGKIRFIGLSEVSVEEIESARRTVDIVSVQNEYNIANRKSEPVLEYCEREGLAFIPWFPVASGKLAQPSGKLDSVAKRHGATVAQLSLAWLLHRSPVMVPIAGTSSVEHLEENVKARDLQLSDSEWGELESEASGKATAA